MNDVEKRLFADMKVIYQTGKGNDHLVSVLVPLDTVKALDILSSSEVRKNIGVLESNTYLFPGMQQSSDHCSGWHAINHICMLAGVQNPLLITATKMRHYSSTKYAGFDVPENDRPHFFRHMGHSRHINEAIYQTPLAEAEVTIVGRVLQEIDKGLYF